MKKLLAISALTLSVAAIPAIANATPVDDLKSEMTKMEGIYEKVLPVAIGSMAFSIGAAIIKRVAFS